MKLQQMDLAQYSPHRQLSQNCCLIYDPELPYIDNLELEPTTLGHSQLDSCVSYDASQPPRRYQFVCPPECISREDLQLT